jgi:hypothetical protein
MKFSHYLKKLRESREFDKFKDKNPEAYLAAGFFVLDFECGKDIHQIDYSLPDGKIATFLLDDGVKLKISEQAVKKDLPKVKKKAKTDIDALKGIVEDEMKNRTVTEKIRKIIAILHIMDGKLIWNLQCILSGFEIVQVHVDDSDQTILKFERHSLMDLIKPMQQQLAAMPAKEGSEKDKEVVMTGKDLKKLEEQLKKAVKKTEGKNKGKDKKEKKEKEK